MIEKQRIQKFLSNLGYGSRRKIEQMIKQNRIKVNKQLVNLGDKVSESDDIFLDNKKINLDFNQGITKLIIYHKPIGEICSRSDDKNRKTIFDKIIKLTGERWINIGRLDMNSSGLLLLTNNGELAYRMMHPSYEIEREYLVSIKGKMDKNKINTLLKGIEVKSDFLKISSINFCSSQKNFDTYKIIIKTGKNREIRRLIKYIDCLVVSLKRIRYGNIMLVASKPGDYITIAQNQIKTFAKLVKLTI